MHTHVCSFPVLWDHNWLRHAVRSALSTRGRHFFRNENKWRAFPATDCKLFHRVYLCVCVCVWVRANILHWMWVYLCDCVCGCLCILNMLQRNCPTRVFPPASSSQNLLSPFLPPLHHWHLTQQLSWLPPPEHLLPPLLPLHVLLLVLLQVPEVLLCPGEQKHFQLLVSTTSLLLLLALVGFLVGDTSMGLTVMLSAGLSQSASGSLLSLSSSLEASWWVAWIL